MPILLLREKGPPKPFRNAEYLPLFYLIPKRILDEFGVAINSIPRTPQRVVWDKSACDVIESDNFLLMILETVGFMVWPFMGFKEDINIYSMHDPACALAHSAAFWMQALLDFGFLPTVEVLVEKCDVKFGYAPEIEVEWMFRQIVPHVMEKYHMHDVIKVAKEMRCFEDFSVLKSWKKKDFRRQWYHSRTKHPMVSLEEYQDSLAKWYDGMERDVPDTSQNVEEDVVSQLYVDEFMTTLSDKDKAILQMRLEGYTLEKIAKELGYKNHSGVLKRIRKIGQAFEGFTGEDYGFTEKKII